MRKTAAWLMRRALEELGVEYTFGIPGVHNIELYDELHGSGTIQPILVTHEVGAAFMADAIGRVTDGIGVLVVVPAAGITHAMSGVGEAFLDGIPMLVVSGGVRTDLPFGYQLHDVDQQALMRPLTKACFRIEDYADVVPTVYAAYRIATSGEPGPVYIELPANLQLLAGPVDDVPAFETAPTAVALDQERIERAAALLAGASRPGIFVGWGARGVTAEITRIAEHLNAPVATTLQGLASFPGDHPLHCGMGFGPSAVPAAENAFDQCDAMLAVGTRFAEISTGSFGSVPPQQLVHIDINPKVPGRNFPAAVAIVADARAAVPALAERLLGMSPDASRGDLRSAIAADKAAWLQEWEAHDSQGRVNPGRFFAELRRQLDPDAIVVADDGNHTFLTAELLPIHAGGMFLSPTDFNSMGYCVPASIAARLACPERQVVGIVGDGAFLMTGMETVTAVSLGIGIAWFVFNDGALDQIGQAQEMPYGRRSCTELGALNYRAMAQATGCAYVSIASDADIEAGITAALEHVARDRPVLVDVRIDYSKKTRFTTGTLKTNIARFDTRNKVRIVGRALWRKLGKRAR